MTGDYELGSQRPAGTNIHNQTPCPTCDGHRLILVSEDKGFDVYARCSSCNPAPTVEREPVSSQSWWKDKL